MVDGKEHSAADRELGAPWRAQAQRADREGVGHQEGHDRDVSLDRWEGWGVSHKDAMDALLREAAKQRAEIIARMTPEDHEKERRADAAWRRTERATNYWLDYEP